MAYTSAGSCYGAMEARNGGAVLVPQLGVAVGMRFTLGAGGVLALPALIDTLFEMPV